MAPTPTSSELLALADKYADMSRLRRAHGRGMPEADVAELRALARAFPGSLRELDRLPTDEIDRREERLRAAGRGGEVEPWMSWLHDYHGALRAALHAKALRARAHATGAEELSRIASERASFRVDAAFVERLFSQPRCSILFIALEETALRHGVAVDAVRARVLPSR